MNYKKGVEKLSLNQFTIMLEHLKVEKKKYKVFIRYDYYLILDLKDCYDKVIKDFFKSLQSL